MAPGSQERMVWQHTSRFLRSDHARWFVVAGLLLSGIACLAPCVVTGEEPEVTETDGADLAEIIEGLNAWRNSFVNLDLVWEMTNESEEAAARGVPSPFVRERWVWADHGIFAHEIKNFVGGEHGWLDVWNLPKELSYRADYAHDPEKGEVFEKLEVHRTQGSRPISWMAVTPLMGVYFNATAKWLGEHLAEWDVTLDGYEEIDGHRCVRVRPAELMEATLWLDVEHDFLIRRYLMPSIPDKQRRVEFVVRGFQQLDTGRWFPESGSTDWEGDDSIYEWRVTSVAVNQEVDAADWLPPRPEVGTVVIDARTGRSYRVAHEGDREAIYRHIVDAANRNVGNPTASANWRTRIPGKLLWIAGLLAMSIVLLFVGLRFSKRSRGSLS